MDFEIRNIAFHYVDPAGESPILGEREFDIDAQFDDEADRVIVRDFFDTHLRSMWADESAAAVSADFDAGPSTSLASPRSPVEGQLAHVSRGNGETAPQADFLAFTQSLASRLHAVSPSTASPGLLMAVAFSPMVGNENSDHYLALMKLDPGTEELLTLRQRNEQIVLELAVEHIELALPEAGRRVLKWAILPHPEKRSIAAKVHDRQTRGKPAAYFMDFLGATPHRSDIEVLREISTALEDYAYAAEEDQPWHEAMPTWQRAASELVATGRSVTRSEIVQAVVDSGARPPTDPDGLATHLQGRGIGRVRATDPDKIARRTLRYELDNGITISGRSDAMLGLVTIQETTTGSKIFSIEAATYDQRWMR